MNELYIGIMSGTSLDGVDAVLAAARGARLRFRGSAYLPYSAGMRARLLALQVRQGLESAGAPIANVEPQAVLSLFRA